MTPINKLSGIDTVSLGDLLALFSQNEGDVRKISVSQLLAMVPSSAMVTQYAAPTATGFTVTVAQADTRLIITPGAGYAAGAIALPSATHGQKLVVNCTQAVTSLSFSNGTVIGGPTTLSANAFFTLEYEAVLGRWYRIG